MFVIPRLVSICLLGAAVLWAPAGAFARPHVPGQVIVRFKGAAPASSPLPGAHMEAVTGGPSRLLKLAPGRTIAGALKALRRHPGVRYAAPNYMARAAGFRSPDDPGRSKADGWEAVQWNFLPAAGVDALGAWAHVTAAGRPGARGVKIAVLDSGIAYRDWGPYRASPDFNRTRFLRGYDFLHPGDPPVDRNGHGTHVTGTIAESTNNGIGLTGLAYNAWIIPVRILDRDGSGTELGIARGIRFAVRRGAQIINLSVEFPEETTGNDLPELGSAIRYADRHRVLLVGAAGNEAKPRVAYPASASTVLSVGATTDDRCLASYSNDGSHLDIVAPGGGEDSESTGEPNCHPHAFGRDIYQMTFTSSLRRFGLPGGYQGTSMAAAHVAATAALVIASGVIGPRPTPSAIVRRLEHTAHDLGPLGPDSWYGAGLVDAAAATDPAL